MRAMRCSNDSNAGTSILYSVMFSDSITTDKFQLGADKMRYSNNFDPHFKKILMENIKESDFYVESYGESCCFFFFSICLDVPHLTNEHRTQDCIAS